MKLLLLFLLLLNHLYAQTNFIDSYEIYKSGNHNKAFKLFKEISKNDLDAAYMLAKMYENGEGCEVNAKEALKWYKISSKGYFTQNNYTPTTEIDKQVDEIYSTLEKSQDNATQDTIRQVSKSLYNFKAYKANYFLPYSYRFKGSYADTNSHKAKDTEVEFQVSLIYDIAHNLLNLNEIYSLAYTQKSFWQFYSKSAYFRESSYNPEMFVTIPTSNIHDGRLIKLVRLGLAHESNGRGGVEERSWNYINATVVLQYKTLFTELELWSRLSDKVDYNPDLLDYLGHGQLKFILPYKKHLFSTTLRQNFKNKKGSSETTYSYPLFGRDDLFLYTKFFNGYGESLIDYNNHVKKFGIGFSISR